MSLLVIENLFFKENYSKLGNIAPNCELIVHVKLEAIRK